MRSYNVVHKSQITDKDRLISEVLAQKEKLEKDIEGWEKFKFNQSLELKSKNNEIHTM